MKSVFSNTQNAPAPTTRTEIVKNAHPNNMPYKWQPNRNFFSMKQPHEKGNFFKTSGKTGTGALGGKSNDLQRTS